jgi:hypothetical protein
MAEFIHEHSTGVKSEDGTTYIVRIYGQERTDGTWEGWLETNDYGRCLADNDL